MNCTMMTRRDEVGVGKYDSIAWIFETVLHEPDNKECNSAIVYGNEDSPEKIVFYRSANPEIGETSARTWLSPENDSEKPTMKYQIVVNGKSYQYESLEAAKKTAEDVFKATGIVLGITAIA